MEGMSMEVPNGKRKAGEKMSVEERASKTIDNIVSYIGQFIRSDYGSKDPVEVTSKKAREWAKKNGVDFSDNGYQMLGKFGVEMADRTREGIKERVNDSREELKRRIDLLKTARQYLESGDAVRAKRLIDQAILGTDKASDSDGKVF